jgi:hypothetical protein
MSAHLITTSVRRAACPTCRADVLVGFVDGWSMAVEVGHLQPLAEIAVLAAGRHTFDLVRCGQQLQLCWRDAGRMRHRKHPVLAEHPCFQAALLAQDPLERAVKRKRLTPLNEAGPQLSLPISDQPPPF